MYTIEANNNQMIGYAVLSFGDKKSIENMSMKIHLKVFPLLVFMVNVNESDEKLLTGHFYLYKFEKGFLTISLRNPSHSQLYFYNILHLIYFIKNIMGTLHSHVFLKQEVNSN